MSFLYNTLLLRYSFGWADFLSRYAWFMVGAPVALWLITQRKTWLFASASFVVWLTLRKVDMLLPFSAWQFIFVIGIIMGYHYPHIVEWYRKRSPSTRQTLYYATLSITCVSFIGSLICFTIMPHLADAYPAIQHTTLWSTTTAIRTTIAPFTDKNTLAPLRLAVSLVWFVGLYTLVRPHERAIDRHSRGVLQLFGKNSLYVYGWHAFILFLIEIYLKPAGGGSTDVGLSSLVALLALSTVYLLARYRHVFTRKKQQLANVLLPVPDESS